MILCCCGGASTVRRDTVGLHKAAVCMSQGFCSISRAGPACICRVCSSAVALGKLRHRLQTKHCPEPLRDDVIAESEEHYRTCGAYRERDDTGQDICRRHSRWDTNDLAVAYSFAISTRVWPQAVRVSLSTHPSNTSSWCHHAFIQIHQPRARCSAAIDSLDGNMRFRGRSGDLDPRALCLVTVSRPPSKV